MLQLIAKGKHSKSLKLTKTKQLDILRSTLVVFSNFAGLLCARSDSNSSRIRLKCFCHTKRGWLCEEQRMDLNVRGDQRMDKRHDREKNTAQM